MILFFIVFSIDVYSHYLKYWRFEPYGKYASLDWMTQDQLSELNQQLPYFKESFQYYRGRYLKYLFILSMITIPIDIVVQPVICCVFGVTNKKEEDYKSKDKVNEMLKVLKKGADRYYFKS